MAGVAMQDNDALSKETWAHASCNLCAKLLAPPSYLYGAVHAVLRMQEQDGRRERTGPNQGNEGKEAKKRGMEGGYREDMGSP